MVVTWCEGVIGGRWGSLGSVVVMTWHLRVDSGGEVVLGAHHRQ
jgi:hypothetical protein